MKKKLAVLLCAVLLMGITACAQQASETASDAAETGAQEQDGAVYGQVTAIDDDEATIVLGTVNGGMPPAKRRPTWRMGKHPPAKRRPTWRVEK